MEGVKGRRRVGKGNLEREGERRNREEREERGERGERRERLRREAVRLIRTKMHGGGGVKSVCFAISTESRDSFYSSNITVTLADI